MVKSIQKTPEEVLASLSESDSAALGIGRKLPKEPTYTSPIDMLENTTQNVCGELEQLFRKFKDKGLAVTAGAAQPTKGGRSQVVSVTVKDQSAAHLTFFETSQSQQLFWRLDSAHDGIRGDLERRLDANIVLADCKKI